MQQTSAVVYHGGRVHCANLVPHHNTRQNERGAVIFNQMSVHASPHLWVALAYLCWQRNGCSVGIDLYGEKKEVAIFGPQTIECALHVLYGLGGYVHTLPAESFTWVKGLGPLEVIATKSVRPKQVDFVPNPVKKMRDEGVTFTFLKTE